MVAIYIMSDELRYCLNVFIIARMPKYEEYFEGNKCTEDVSPTNNITKAMIRPTVENKIFQYLNFIICYNFVINYYKITHRARHCKFYCPQNHTQ